MNPVCLVDTCIFDKTVFSLHTTLYWLFLWFWIFLYISVGDVERRIQRGWSGSPSESSHSCSGTSRLYGPRRDSSWASFWRKKLVLWVYILVKSFVYTFFCFITISMCTNASTLIKSSQKCVSFIII